MDTEVILDYEGFRVVYDYSTHKYMYIDEEETCEVFLMARLSYDCIHEPVVNGDYLSMIFDCFCCGEYVGDESIEYLWFSTEESEEEFG